MRTPAIAVIVGVSLLVSGPAVWRISAQAQGAASLDAELEKGRQLLQQQEYFDALKQYQRANQLAGGKSADAFLGMALAAQGMKVHKNALDFAQSAIDLAGGNAAW
jgi:Tfp pilus assembly protein PilF